MRDWHDLAAIACLAPDPARLLAWSDSGATLSHADFVARTNSWQALFAARAETRWAIYHEDPFEFAAALFGAWHAGKGVALPADERPATLAELARQGFGLAGDPPGAQRPGPQAVAAPARQALDEEAAELLVFTSGSSGQPEAIPKRLRQLSTELAALEAAFGAALGKAPRATFWATVSHQHIYGLLFLVLWPLAAGRSLGRQRLRYPQEIATRLAGQPAVLVSTPAHLKRLDASLGWDAARAQLRAVFSSGGPLPFEASRAAAELLGRPPIEVFGSSETGGIAWRQAHAADTPWQALPGVDCRIEDGLLAVRSRHLPDAGWHLTSDRAEAHPADHGAGLRLLGRADRIVKIEEKRVSLGLVEQSLLATPWLAQARALVVDTPIGARIGVVAVCTPAGLALAGAGRRALADRLRERLADSLEAMALPKRWRFVEALPLDAQGKSTEPLLRALFAAPAGTPALPPLSWQTREPTYALATLEIDAALPVFDGHFKVAPILPGVAQLDWAIALGRACFALPAQFERLEALKFVRPVQPGTALRVELNFKPALADPKLCGLNFRLYSEDGGEPHEHASGRAIWRHAEGSHA